MPEFNFKVNTVGSTESYLMKNLMFAANIFFAIEKRTLLPLTNMFSVIFFVDYI